MRLLTVAALSCLLTSSIRAQNTQDVSNAPQLLVADASSSGTYKNMLSEIMDVCSNEHLQIVEAPGITGGATNNLDALVNNRVSAAFLHSDVIYAAAQADPAYRQLKTLISLYPEDIHVLTLRNSKTRHLLRTVDYNSLSDLAGASVGAAGGGVITARILTGQGEGHFNVVDEGSGKKVLDELLAGNIQAAIFVGGSPLPNLVSLSAEQFKLIPIGEAISSRVSGVYRSTIINYPNLNSGPIKTMAPMATLLTRRYTLPKLVRPQALFRSCFFAHLTELKETPGRHPKWQLVDPADHGVWEWYDIPSTR